MGCGWSVHTVRNSVFLCRRSVCCVRDFGRIHRPDLRRGSAATAVRGARGNRTPAGTEGSAHRMKTVLLAYHEIGCAGLEFLKHAGAEITAVFTHEDDPGENLWFG